jgi:hypothetical protein
VTTVDEEGCAIWGRYWKAVPYSDLISAAEAGALDGDPFRPYLVIQPEVGNGLGVDWPTVINLWDLAYYVLDRAAVFIAGRIGAKMVIDRLRARTRGGRDVTSHRYREWRARGANPYSLRTFLAEQPRTSADVARLLGCSREEADAVLLALGFSQAEGSDEWIPAADEEARVSRGELRTHRPRLQRDRV